MRLCAGAIRHSIFTRDTGAITKYSQESIIHCSKGEQSFGTGSKEIFYEVTQQKENSKEFVLEL